jgi:hypothetical protein
MRTIECNCEKNFEVDIPDIFDLDQEPQRLEEIINGSFLTFKCPHCDSIIKPELPFEVIRKSKKFHLFFVPEQDRSKVRAGEITVNTDNPDGLAVRLVIGYFEFVEKLNMLEMDLNDLAIEVLKYHILTKAVSLESDVEEDEQTRQPGEATDKKEETGTEADAIYVYFREKKANQLIFHIHNLRPDDVAIIKLNLEVYEKSLKNLEQTLRKDPFKEILSLPYVSINKLYMEK